MSIKIIFELFYSSIEKKPSATKPRAKDFNQLKVIELALVLTKRLF